jgi:hypothetical protein
MAFNKSVISVIALTLLVKLDIFALTSLKDFDISLMEVISCPNSLLLF